MKVPGGGGDGGDGMGGGGEGDGGGGLGDGGEACGQTDSPGPSMPPSAMQAPVSANQRQEAPLAFVFEVQTSQEALAAAHSLESFELPG